MSEQGPRLLRTKGGYAYAKFNGRKVNFGRHDDPDARPRFDAFKARWLLNGREVTDDMLPDRAVRRDALTVDQLAVMFLAHLRERYDADWQRCNYGRIEHSLKPMRSLYGPDPAESFTPKRLQSVRRHMIDGGKLSRREINRRVLEIRRCFKWAVAEELVPGDRAHALAAIEGLRPGEYGARETEKVRPVEREVVDATLPYLTKPLAGLVELMWWCGARPSELFDLRPMDFGLRVDDVLALLGIVDDDELRAIAEDADMDTDGLMPRSAFEAHPVLKQWLENALDEQERPAAF